MKWKEKEKIDREWEAAILDWVKSVILVTLYQQQRRDKRLRECLCREIPSLQRQEYCRYCCRQIKVRGGGMKHSLRGISRLMVALIKTFFILKHVLLNKMTTDSHQ